MSIYANLTWSLQVEKLLPPILRDKTFIEQADDFKSGDADNNLILFIVDSSPGSWKEFPTIGVGIFKYLHSTTSPTEIERDIRVQLKSDIFANPLVNARDFPIIIVNRIVIRVDG